MVDLELSDGIYFSLVLRFNSTKVLQSVITSVEAAAIAQCNELSTRT